MSNDLVIHEQNGVVTIRLNRPNRRNAFTLGQLVDLASALRSYPAVQGAILLGSESWFSSGMDLDELTGTEDDELIDEYLADIHGAIHDASFPVIAAVEGGCIGAGLDVAMRAMSS